MRIPLDGAVPISIIIPKEFYLEDGLQQDIQRFGYYRKAGIPVEAMRSGVSDILAEWRNGPLGIGEFLDPEHLNQCLPACDTANIFDLVIADLLTLGTPFLPW